MIRFGPAGWDYKDWKGRVYPSPPPKGFHPLEYLSRYFRALEINSSFYRPPSAKVAAEWAERVKSNSGFRFTAKLWRRFTHQRTAWTADEVAEARQGLDVLQDRGCLGALLLQFPWSFRRTEENREWLRDVLTAFGHYPLVLEIRHSSWNVPELYDSLTERGVGFVNIDQPLFHDSLEPTAYATSPIAYVRVHGRNYRDWFRRAAESAQRYDYFYSAAELEPWAERVGELAARPNIRELYVVTNNHFEGKAPANALMLQSMVERRRVESPPVLYRTYTQALAPYAAPA